MGNVGADALIGPFRGNMPYIVIRSFSFLVVPVQQACQLIFVIVR
jgi:hypothetical protein